MPAMKLFGTLADGREAHLYTLEVPGGWRATVTDYGAILTSFLVPPKAGTPGDAVDVVPFGARERDPGGEVVVDPRELALVLPVNRRRPDFRRHP